MICSAIGHRIEFIHSSFPSCTKEPQAHSRCRASGPFLLCSRWPPPHQAIADIHNSEIPGRAVGLDAGAAEGLGFQKAKIKNSIGQAHCGQSPLAGGARSALSTWSASGAVWATGVPPRAAAVHGRGFCAGGQACCPSRSGSNLSPRIRSRHPSVREAHSHPP